jgi:FixJ family two-component response regulator
MRESPVGVLAREASTLRSALPRTSPAVSEPGPTVFIVDDDVSVREALEALVAAAGFVPKVFASAEEFLSRPPQRSPSCVILDLNLPDTDGLEVQKRLSATQAEVPVIFLTGHGDIPSTVRAMKAGAAEFLTKPFRPEALLSVIESAIERSRAGAAQQAEMQLLRQGFESLSPREHDVLKLVVAGFLNKQVGAELGISEITVKAHRGRVMRKMKAKSLAELVRISARLGLATGNRR